MTTQELIELSLLDVFGVLDDAEHEAFEAGFRAAPPTVQAQVRREQTRLARIDALLPDVTPPAGLRAAVIEAVRRAMAEPEPVEGLADRAGYVVPPLVQSRRVSPLWRAAALGLATAAVMLGGTTIYIQNEIKGIASTIQGDSFMASLSKELGPKFVNDVLFDGDTQRVVFRAEGATSKSHASLFINPEWKRAKFFCEAISTPEGRTYRLAIVDDQDAVQEVLATFSSNGELMSKELEFHGKPGSKLAILTSAPTVGSQEYEVISRADFKDSSM